MEVDTSLQSGQGFSPIGKDWLSLVVSSMYAAYEAAGTDVTTTMRLTEPWSLTMASRKQGREQGREQLASQSTEEARWGMSALMSAASEWGARDERGVKDLLAALARRRGAF